MLEVLGGPFFVILLVVGGVVALAARESDNFRSARTRTAAWAVLGVAAALVAVVGVRVALPAQPVASVEARVDGPALVVPSDAGHVSLMVRGHLPPVSTGQEASGTFVVDIFDDGDFVKRVSGTLDERWTSRNVGRGGGKMQSLVEHTEARVDLPSELVGHPITVTVHEVAGELRGPLTLEAIPAPPSLLPLEAVTVALIGAGAAVDAVERRRTHVALAVGFLGAFAFFLLTGITPHGPARAAFGAGLAALPTGVLLAYVLRSIIAGIVGDRFSAPAPQA